MLFFYTTFCWSIIKNIPFRNVFVERRTVGMIFRNKREVSMWYTGISSTECKWVTSWGHEVWSVVRISKYAVIISPTGWSKIVPLTADAVTPETKQDILVSLSVSWCVCLFIFALCASGVEPRYLSACCDMSVCLSAYLLIVTLPPHRSAGGISLTRVERQALAKFVADDSARPICLLRDGFFDTFSSICKL